MTVRALIESLQALPEEQKNLEVRCTYDCGFAVTEVHGIYEVKRAWDYNYDTMTRENERDVVVLQGD